MDTGSRILPSGTRTGAPPLLSRVVTDPDAVTYIARMRTAPSTALAALINKTFVTLKAADIYNYLVQFQKCNIHNEADAKLNWISTNFNLIPVGSPTFTAKKGWLNASGKYLKSGFNCATEITNGRIGLTDFGMTIDRFESDGTVTFFVLNGAWDSVYSSTYRVQFVNPCIASFPYCSGVLLSDAGSYTDLVQLYSHNGFFSADKGGSPVTQTFYTDGSKTGSHNNSTIDYAVNNELWFGNMNPLNYPGDAYMRTIAIKRYLGVTKELAFYNICKYFNDNVNKTF